MPKQTIGVRVSDELLQAIDERCQTIGLSRTELLLNLIQQGLNVPIVNDVNSVNSKEAAYPAELPKKSQNWVIR